MGFNENAFMLWGTGIAIFGVAYTIWDSKKKKISNAYKKYINNNNNDNGTANNQILPQTPVAVNTSNNIEPVTPQDAGSKRRKRKNKKTKKRRK